MPNRFTIIGDTALCTPCAKSGRADCRPELPLVRHPLMIADIVDVDGVHFFCPRGDEGYSILQLFLLRSGEVRDGRLVAKASATCHRRIV